MAKSHLSGTKGLFTKLYPPGTLYPEHSRESVPERKGSKNDEALDDESGEIEPFQDVPIPEPKERVTRR